MGARELCHSSPWVASSENAPRASKEQGDPRRQATAKGLRMAVARALGLAVKFLGRGYVNIRRWHQEGDCLPRPTLINAKKGPAAAWPEL